MATPLMPKATAVWLIDNTSLTFQQIADFCGLHVLEVNAIADDNHSTRITGVDPVRAGQLTMQEIERCQADPAARLVKLKGPEQSKRTKGPRYTPVSKRQDKPDAIAWLLRHHPELSDGQIGKLIGSTKQTIAAIRDRTHWNIQAIKPLDPVALGLCLQTELDALVAQANQASAAPADVARQEAERADMEAALKREREEQAQAEAEARLAAEAQAFVSGGGAGGESQP